MRIYLKTIFTMESGSGYSDPERNLPPCMDTQKTTQIKQFNKELSGIPHRAANTTIPDESLDRMPGGKG